MEHLQAQRHDPAARKPFGLFFFAWGEGEAGGFEVEADLPGAQPQVAAVDAESLPASVEFFAVALQRPAYDDEVQLFALVPQQLFPDGPRQARLPFLEVVQQEAGLFAAVQLCERRGGRAGGVLVGHAEGRERGGRLGDISPMAAQKRRQMSAAGSSWQSSGMTRLPFCRASLSLSHTAVDLPNPAGASTSAALTFSRARSFSSSLGE